MPAAKIITQGTQAVGRSALPERTWQEINEPGTYVEKGTGDLYRVPKEALVPGASPSIFKEALVAGASASIVKESRGASVLVKLSDDPFLITFKARLLCAQHNIEPSAESVVEPASIDEQKPEWRNWIEELARARVGGPRFRISKTRAFAAGRAR